MDDTIECLSKPWIKCINERYGTSVNPEDVKFWDAERAFPELTKEQVYAPLYEDEFWKTVYPIEGAAEALQYLIEAMGHEVYIVTSSYYETLKSKMDHVLFKYFPFLTWDNVIITSRKQLINGDVLIDDGFHNHVGGSYEKILIDAPYNRNCDIEALGGYRVRSWDEILEIIYMIGVERMSRKGVGVRRTGGANAKN